MSKPFDYIIAGQGIAGTVLAFTLMQKGKTVFVADKPNPSSSSRTAGGIVNPITGRKMVKTWLADQLFPKAHQFYNDLDSTLKIKSFHSMNMFFPFDNQEKQTDWLSSSADEKYTPYIVQFHKESIYPEVNGKFGGMEVKQSGYLEIGSLLDNFKKYISEKGCYSDEKIKPDEILLSENGVEWKGIKAKRVIFCEGSKSAENPFFPTLDFRNVKGELLLVKFKNARFKHIVNRNGFILPIDDKGTCKVGATYDHKDLSTVPTERGKSLLLEKIENLIDDEFEVLDQWAGIRPATFDRRPFIGIHKEHPQVGIFNGLGTKGVSLAPYFAEHFYQHLEEGSELMPDINFTRINKSYHKRQS